MKKQDGKVNRLFEKTRCIWFYRLVVITVAVLIVGGSAGAADWPTYMHDNQRSGVTTEQFELPLNPVWVRDTLRSPRPAWAETPALQNFWGGSYGHRTRVLYDQSFGVVVVGDSAFFGSSNSDKVTSLNLLNGAENWKFFTGGPVRFAPSVDNGKVYFGSDDGYVYCLDASTGTPSWPTPVRSTSSPELIFANGTMASVAPVRTSVLVEDGSVYWAAGVFSGAKTGLNRYLCSRSASNGTGGWTVTPGNPSQGYLLSADGNLYVPAGKRQPLRFNQSTGGGETSVGVTGCFALIVGGTFANGPAYSSTGSYINDPGASIARVDGNCLIVSGGYSYYCTDYALVKLQRSNGAQQWNVPSVYRYSLIMAGDTIFAGGDGEVAAFSSATGEQLWSAPVIGRARSLTAANRFLLVGTDRGIIHAFSAEACNHPADFNHDCIVDTIDLMMFVERWLDCTNPNDEDCVSYLP